MGLLRFVAMVNSGRRLALRTRGHVSVTLTNTRSNSAGNAFIDSSTSISVIQILALNNSSAAADDSAFQTLALKVLRLARI